MLRNLVVVLQREPTAIGTVVASVLPALVAVNLLDLDQQAMAFIVVAVNSVLGLCLRLCVSPSLPPVQASRSAVAAEEPA